MRTPEEWAEWTLQHGLGYSPTEPADLWSTVEPMREDCLRAIADTVREALAEPVAFLRKLIARDEYPNELFFTCPACGAKTRGAHTDDCRLLALLKDLDGPTP